MLSMIRWSLRLFIFLATISILQPAHAIDISSLEPGYHKGLSVKVNGIKRTFNISVPNYNKSNFKLIPALILLHGGGGKDGHELYEAKVFLPKSHTDATKRTSRPVLAIYPDSWIDGEHRQWNDHRAETEDGIDDVQFLKKIKNVVVDQLNVDENKVYVTGVSNGGMLTYRTMCEAQGAFAGFAPVIANIPKALESNRYINQCTDLAKVIQSNYECKILENGLKKPTLLMFGQEDTMMPYNGGCAVLKGDGRGGQVISAQETLAILKEQAECLDDWSKKKNLDSIDDQTKPMYYEYSCKKSGKLGVVDIEGAGHAPANNIITEIPSVPAPLRPSKDFNSADFILKFFNI